MVSLFPCEGSQVRQNSFDILTQSPNYLYDPFAFPSNLSFLDYHWNLFDPQNSYAVQTKRKKKMKEQVVNERSFKDILPSFEYKKEELVSWLKSLTVEKKLEVFSIHNEWLVATLIKMYKRWSDDHKIVFALLLDSKKQNGGQDMLNLNIEKDFYCRHKPREYEVSAAKRESLEKAEKEIIENISVYDSNELYDSIQSTENLIQDIDRLVSLFETISGGLAFTKPCKLTYEHGTKNIVWDSPHWFSAYSFQSFAAWIISSLEKAVWARFFQEKIGGPKHCNANFEGKELRINLKYKHNLIDFWKNLEESKKKKLLGSISETYKLITSEKSKNEKELKEVDQRLRNLFSTLYFNKKTYIPSAADIAGYFQSLFESESDDNAIDQILMTRFDNFGNLTNLICRKLTHRLKNMLADQIATDLILNEEKEKITKKKNEKKKKVQAQKKLAKESPCLLPKLNIAELDDCAHHKEENEEETKASDLKLEDSHDHDHNSTVCECTNTAFTEHSTQATPRAMYEGDLTFFIRTILNKIICQSLNLVESDSLSNKDSILTQGSESNMITPDASTLGRKPSFSVSHNRHDEVSTDHSIEEFKRDLEMDFKHEEKFIFISEMKPRESTPTRMKSRTCDNGDAKCLKHPDEVSQEKRKENKHRMRFQSTNVITKEEEESSKHNKMTKSELMEKSEAKSFKEDTQIVAKTEMDTTDSESSVQRNQRASTHKQSQAANHRREAIGNRHDMPVKEQDDFIEVKPKKKKSVKPPVKNQKKDVRNIQKKKESTFVEKSEKIERAKPAGQTQTKTIAGPAAETKKIESPKKTVGAVAQTSSSPAKVSQPCVTPLQTTEKSVTSLEVKPEKPAVAEVISTSPVDQSPTTQEQEAPKPKKCLKKLSLASKALDFGTIKMFKETKVKALAKEFFENKLAQDIYSHVSEQTKESNKLTDKRILVFKRLEHCIPWIFPMYNMKTKIFGSCATGLALATSDIDIAVVGIETDDRGILCDCLSTISRILQNFKWVVSCKEILTAHVPVLKLEIDPFMDFSEVGETSNDDKQTIEGILGSQIPELNHPKQEEKFLIKVDLTLEGLGIMGYTVLMGYKSTELAEKMLAKYKSFYIITMILKEFLFNRKLLNTYQGGVSSYCLILMIIAVLQKFGEEGFMKSIRRILKFYGEDFQPENTGIAPFEIDPFFPLHHAFDNAPFWIVDQNFMVEKRNIGQGTYMIKLILLEFANATKILEYLQEQFETFVLQHQDKVQNLEDIQAIDDAELKGFLATNLLDSFIMCSK